MNYVKRVKKTLKQIAIDENNYLILKSLGRTGDSFNDVLTSILKIYTNRLTNLDSKIGSKIFLIISFIPWLSI